MFFVFWFLVLDLDLVSVRFWWDCIWYEFSLILFSRTGWNLCLEYAFGAAAIAAGTL
jgi:hypothetical protein